MHLMSLRSLDILFKLNSYFASAWPRCSEGKVTVWWYTILRALSSCDGRFIDLEIVIILIQIRLAYSTRILKSSASFITTTRTEKGDISSDWMFELMLSFLPLDSNHHRIWTAVTRVVVIVVVKILLHSDVHWGMKWWVEFFVSAAVPSVVIAQYYRRLFWSAALWQKMMKNLKIGASKRSATIRTLIFRQAKVILQLLLLMRHVEHADCGLSRLKLRRARVLPLELGVVVHFDYVGYPLE